MRLSHAILRPALSGRTLELFCFPAAVGTYLLLVAGLRTAAAKTLLLDESELLTLSQTFALGYGNQPPLAVWLLWAVTAVVGPSAGAVIALRFAVLGLLYVGLFACGRALTMSPARAALGAAGALLVPAVSWDFVLDKTHTPLACAAAALTVAALLSALRGDGLHRWAILGACVGLGVMSKYTFVPFAAGLVFAALTIPDCRRRLLSSRGAVAALVATAVALPHLVWVVVNREELTGGIARAMTDRPYRSAGVMLGSAADVAFMSCGVVLAVFAVLVPGVFRRNRELPPGAKLLGRALAFGAALAVAAVLLSGGNRFKPYWFTPLAVLLPVCLVARMEPLTVSRSRVAALWATLALGVLGTSVGMVALGQSDRLRQGRQLHARDRLAADLAATLADSPGPVVCGSLRDAGNVRLGRPGSPVAVLGTPRGARPAIGDAAVLVWDASVSDVIAEAEVLRLAREFGLRPAPGARPRFVGGKPSAERPDDRRLGVTPLAAVKSGEAPRD